MHQCGLPFALSRSPRTIKRLLCGVLCLLGSQPDDKKCKLQWKMATPGSPHAFLSIFKCNEMLSFLPKNRKRVKGKEKCGLQPNRPRRQLPSSIQPSETSLGSPADQRSAVWQYAASKRERVPLCCGDQSGQSWAEGGIWRCSAYSAHCKENDF